MSSNHHPLPCSKSTCSSISRRTIWQQISSGGKHLSCAARHESIHLPCILLHLPCIQHTLQPTRLVGQFEQPLPLILRQGWLLRQCSCGVLCLSLRLPLCNLGLFSRQCAVVVAEVVGLHVVCLDGLKEVVCRLTEEWIVGEGEGVERGRDVVVCDSGV